MENRTATLIAINSLAAGEPEFTSEISSCYCRDRTAILWFGLGENGSLGMRALYFDNQLFSFGNSFGLECLHS